MMYKIPYGAIAAKLLCIGTPNLHKCLTMNSNSKQFYSLEGTIVMSFVILWVATSHLIVCVANNQLFIALKPR